MAYLLDTHVLVWFGVGGARLSPAFHALLTDADAEFVVSSVTAFEFEELRARNRLGDVDSVSVLIRALNAVVADFPAAAYELVHLLPKLHRDPADRMLVAHAIHADLTLVTADAVLRNYPVRSLW